jgi:mRNA interferase YafQ
VKRLERRGKDLGKLKVVLLLLLDGAALPEAYGDHALKGEWRGFRDLHVEPDWLQLARAGTHADLFDE